MDRLRCVVERITYQNAENGYSVIKCKAKGFPIWYGGAPNVINTFAKGYDWKGKRIGIFATSGGSGIGKTAAKLQPYVEGAKIADAQVNLPLDEEALKAWAEKIIASSIENLEKWAETI